MKRQSLKESSEEEGETGPGGAPFHFRLFVLHPSFSSPSFWCFFLFLNVASHMSNTTTFSNCLARTIAKPTVPIQNATNSLK
jgi:hypothetical protein